jgi:fructokinase
VATPLIGAIEAGGTKIVCAVASDPGDLQQGAPHIVATTDPAHTVDAILEYFAPFAHSGDLAAIGIGSFGPLDHASISVANTTPKVSWRGFDWGQAIRPALGDLPIGFDTDTNAAVLAEATLGVGRGDAIVVYVTVGTGIGGGIAIEGQPLHGLLHPELGHMLIPRDPSDRFPGSCPNHGDCLEGLASGAAMEVRWGQRAETLEPGHQAFDLEATYLAAMCVTITTMVAPSRIVLGGGVAGVPGLLREVRQRTAASLNGYLALDRYTTGIDQYIVRPGLADRSGIIGAWLLGRRALESSALGEQRT